MYRDVLSEYRPLSDHHPARFFGPGHILRIVSHHRMHMDLGIATDLCARTDICMAMDLATGLEDHTRLDDGEGTDRHIRGQFGLGVNHGSLVDRYRFSSCGIARNE